MVVPLPPPRQYKDLVLLPSRKYESMKNSRWWQDGMAGIIVSVLLAQIIIFPVITESAILRLSPSEGQRQRSGGNTFDYWSDAIRNKFLEGRNTDVATYTKSDTDRSRTWKDPGMDVFPVFTEDQGIMQRGRRDKKGFSVIPRFLPYISPQPIRKMGGVQQRSLSGEDYSENMPRRFASRPFRPRLRWG